MHRFGAFFNETKIEEEKCLQIVQKYMLDQVMAGMAM